MVSGFVEAGDFPGAKRFAVVVLGRPETARLDFSTETFVVRARRVFADDAALGILVLGVDFEAVVFVFFFSGISELHD